MGHPIYTILQSEFDEMGLNPLLQIPQPPKALWGQGQMPGTKMKLLAVVGSRKYTTYGKQVVNQLLSDLRGYPVGIVSGLALGIDSLAHEAALENELYTLSVPGSGLDRSVLYPPRHKRLADRILENGGGLLSEFTPDFRATKWSFTQRNRIMAGLSSATLLIEAAPKSGTLITARLATDYNRELLVVPGSIFSQNSIGVHQFLKLGATPVTEAADILLALGIEVKELGEAAPRPALSPQEEKIVALLHEPTERDLLIRQLNLPTNEASAILMQMEIKGYIENSDNTYRTLIF